MIKFFIPGIPGPSGSKKGIISRFASKKTGKHFVAMVDSGGERTKNWRANCTFFARQAYTGPLLDGPLFVQLQFYRTRPKGHFRANGSLKPNAPAFPTEKPDTDKLCRGTLDSITGIIWTDDKIIVRKPLSKDYAEKPGCMVTIYELPALATEASGLFEGAK